MSGLEPLAALGLACNIMNVISFARETATGCRAVFETGTADPSLVKSVAGSVKLFRDLEASLESAPKRLSDDEKELLDIAKESLVAGRDLKAEVDKIVRDSAKGKVGASIKMAVVSKWKTKKIDKLQKAVQEYQRVLETRLLASVCDKSEAIKLQQDERFTRLDSSLQSFIERFALGQTQLAHLFSNEVASIKEHVATKVTGSQRVITEHISSESAETRQDLSRGLRDISIDREQQQVKHDQEKFLASLSFDLMKDRQSQIPQSHKGTFMWMFPGEDLSDDSSTSGESSDARSNSSTGLCCHGSKETHWDCFPCWLESNDRGLYWISGKAGSGKSTLMKFLATSSLTKKYLGTNNGETLVLSHFLWSAGHPMQKSIRGILLSLLHQLLSEDELVLDLVMRERGKTFPKNFSQECSSQELAHVVFFAFSAADHTTCILLDGLDEMSEDDSPSELLLLLVNLSALPKVKLCVSSRPEPIFKRQLENSPRLRVQDLTRVDIGKYVEDKLKPNLELEASKLDHFVQDVCDKADGVFLWVSLAVKSLLRGVSNEDTLEELTDRLNDLPSSLQLLYEQMWNRLNEDKLRYRQDAALYIYFIIEFPAKFKFHLSIDCIVTPLNIFHIMAATDPPFMDGVAEQGIVPYWGDIKTKCEIASRRLEARTAGLLEVIPDSGVVTFIHRSATEFFKNTAAGLKILEHVKLGPEQRLYVMLRAILCYTQFQLQDRRDWASLPRWETSRTVVPADKFALVTYHLVLDKAISVDTGLKVFTDAGILYRSGKWWYKTARETMRPDFNGVAASIGFLESLAPVVQSMQGQPPDTHWSGIYKSYLLTLACSRESVGFPKIAEAKSRQLSWLINHEMLQNVPRATISSMVDSAYWVMTPAMALMSTVLGTFPIEMPAAPELFSKYSSLHGFLDEIIIVEVTADERGTTLGIDPPLFRFIKTYSHLLLEVNLAFCVKLYMRTASGKIQTLESMKGLIDNMRRTEHQSHLRVLAFSIQDSDVIYEPETSADSTCVKDCFEQATVSEDENTGAYYKIPGLWELVVEMATRGSQTARSIIVDDLVRRNLLVREDDILDWPPEPTDGIVKMGSSN